MTFAAVAGQRSDRATPSLRAAPQRQSMETTGRETIYRNRNAVQTNPATSAVADFRALIDDRNCDLPAEGNACVYQFSA